jgi:hypothetical protein
MSTSQNLQVAYYETSEGAQPVREWHEELAVSNPLAADSILAGLHLVGMHTRQSAIESGAVKHIEGAIFEVRRRIRGAQPRVLGFFWRDFFIAAAAEMKDDAKLSERVKREALERRHEWFHRGRNR